MNRKIIYRITLICLFLVICINPAKSQLLITKYYEGSSYNKFIEVTNIGSTTISGTYYLCSFHNAKADAPSGQSPNYSILLPGSISAGTTLLYRHGSATTPAYAVSAAINAGSSVNFNGDDLVIISSTNNTTSWANRTDVIGNGTSWGADKGFYRNCNITSPNTTFTTSEWTQRTNTQMDNAASGDVDRLGEYNCAPSCVAPTTQASGIGFDTITNNQIPVSWTVGNGDGVIVVAKAGASVNDPVDSTDYTANAAFGTGASQIGSTGSYVVYKGTGSNVTVTGLSACTQYTFKVYAYNCTGTDIKYQTAGAANNPKTNYTIIDPPSRPTGISVSNRTSNSMDIDWNAVAGATGYVVKIGDNSTFSNISSPSVAPPSGGNAPWTDDEVIFTNSNNTGLTITGLDPNDIYYYKVYSYELCNSQYYFNNTESTGQNKTNAKSTLSDPSDPAAVCAGENISLNINIADESNAQYQWKVYNTSTGSWDNVSGAPYSGENTATLTINPATSDMNGNQYLCEITNTAHTCVVTTPIQTITVNGLPETPSISDTNNYCDNTDIIRDNPPSGVTWYWQGTNPNGTNSSNSGGTYNVSSDGTYYLRAQSSEGCWSDNSASQEVEIRATPNASMPAATPGCGLGTVTLNSDLNTEQIFFLLDNAGNPVVPQREWTGTANTYDFDGLQDGSYKGKVVHKGCTSSVTGPVILTNKIIPEPPLFSDNNACGNNITITLTADTVGSEATRVRFYADNGTTFLDFDDTEPFTYDVTGVTQGSPVTILAASYSSSTTCMSEKIAATANALSLPGNPTTIGGVSSPRCQQDITDVYATTSTDVDTFSWSISGSGATEGSDYVFPGSKTTSSEQVQWDKDFSGSVTISVTAHNVCGSAGPTTANLVIHDSTAITSQPTDQTECEGNNVTFSVTAIGGSLTYQWKKDGSDITGKTNASLMLNNITNGDTADYTVEVSGACGSPVTSNAATLTVNYVDADAGTDQAISHGAIANLDGSASGGSGNYSYAWSPADSLVDANIEDPTTVNLASTTIFTLTVTDNTSDCEDTNQVTITISGSVLSATASADNISICNGDSTNIHALGSGGTLPYSYTWSSLPVGFSSSSADTTVKPTVDTKYIIEIKDAFNNTAKDTVEIVVNNNPVADAGDSTTICNGDSKIIGDSPTASGGTGPGTYTYSWDNGGDLDDDEIANPEASPTVTTTYIVTVIDDNGCESTDKIQIVVYKIPITENIKNLKTR